MTGTVQSRFVFFELMRIAAPGAYFMFITFFLITAFEIPLGPFQTPFLETALFLAGSIVAGLSFYAKETPKRRKAFQTNQPSTFILERSRTLSANRPLTEDEARRLYFYILNHEIPSNMHDKIFFFGTIYNIMINIRRASFWFGLLGIAGIVFQIALTANTTIYSVLATAVVWCIYLLNVRYNKADRKMQENYLDQIFWLEMHHELIDSLIIQRSRLEP
jgi:hypothetical protein